MTIKFRQFQKKSHVFDVIPNNFWYTDWRPDCCILYQLHIQEKSRKDSAQRWTEIFYWVKNWAGAFFVLPQSAIRELSVSITKADYFNVVWYDTVDRKHSVTAAVHDSSAVSFGTSPKRRQLQQAILQHRKWWFYVWKTICKSKLADNN